MIALISNLPQVLTSRTVAHPRDRLDEEEEQDEQEQEEEDVTRRMEAAGTESCRRRQSATFRAQGALDKRRWSQPHTMRASGSCYKKSMCMGRRIDSQTRRMHALDPSGRRGFGTRKTGFE
jgi:hypothetical protein